MMKNILFRNLKNFKVKGLHGCSQGLLIKRFSENQNKNNKVEPKKGFAYKQIQNKTEKMKEEIK